MLLIGVDGASWKVMGPMIERGELPMAYALLEARAQISLLEAGMRPDYFSVRAAKTLEPAAPGDHDLAILAAAYLGKTRLIDNVTISIP